MTDIDLTKDLPFAMTICDCDGVIIFMNQKATEIFANDGGRALIGKNLLDCHPEPARTKLISMLKNREKNVYTIEKKGIRKIIYQVPWFDGEEYKGFIELSLEIPIEMPHFVRDKS